MLVPFEFPWRILDTLYFASEEEWSSLYSYTASSSFFSSGSWLGGDLGGVLGVHLVSGGGVTSGVPGGEIISTIGNFAGDELCVGGVCTACGFGGVLAGLGWQGHSSAGGAVLALGQITVLCPLSASFFLPGVFFCKRFCCFSWLGGCQFNSNLTTQCSPSDNLKIGKLSNS